MDSQQTQSHWDGAHYDQHSTPQYTTGMEILQHYTFCGDEKVLDIGCGTGRTTQEIARRVPNGHVLGIDQSVSMITAAQRNNTLENLKYSQINVQEMNFTQEFDLIVSNFCLHWVENKVEAFKAIYDALKPQGTALLVMTMRNPIFNELRTQMTHSLTWKPYFHNYIDPTIHLVDSCYDEYAKAVGLSVHRYILDTQTIVFSDLHDFSNHISAITPHLHQLAEGSSKKEQFMQELMQSYVLRVPQDAEGNYRVDYTRIKLHARRLLET